jgi:hypothetical protein
MNKKKKIINLLSMNINKKKFITLPYLQNLILENPHATLRSQRASERSLSILPMKFYGLGLASNPS